MLLKARAFAPANISCLFKIYNHKNPRWKGSYGMGFTVDKGVTVEVSKSTTTKIYFNKKAINFPPVLKVIKTLTKEKVKVDIISPLPLGCGFGLSGASVLATAYAINKLFLLNKSKKSLAVIAHTSEVESRTGLGDVVNQYYGGLLVKFKPSSYFIAQKLSFAKTPVYCAYFSKLSTKSIITNEEKMDIINKSGSNTLKKMQKLLNTNKKILFIDIIKLSKEFAITSGLLINNKTIETIKSIEEKGGHASMIMLGNAVFSNTPFKGAIKLEISNSEASIL